MIFLNCMSSNVNNDFELMACILSTNKFKIAARVQMQLNNKGDYVVEYFVKCLVPLTIKG